MPVLKLCAQLTLARQLVESAVSQMATDHKDEFHVVRLNGFIHTDDKIALREIWRQLGREMEVDDHLVNKVCFCLCWASSIGTRHQLTSADEQLRRHAGFPPRCPVAPVRDHGHATGRDVQIR